MSFNWKKFVDDVDVVCNDFFVDHLNYNGIMIYRYHYGSLLVGAYRFSKESQEDINLINFFENHGVEIVSICRAMEYGLILDENCFNPDFMAENCPYQDYEVLYLAFLKGRIIQEEKKSRYLSTQKL